ncbi:MAG: indolepyruvate oxidoreductase subunit beta [Lachnospiraceae bacterium]|nr:indolepyruvate oxidoreductase subunit beta [Lachnospiraceae bacterium]MBR0087284.1 indolepyruvate oxidoreductase subunit beta [Lachnospiraceae bacterium]
MKTTNIMIVGVGGQGTLLASRLLGQAGLKAGFEVKMSEVHGMSQRGGSVVTYVKLGDKVYSPVIKEGEADFIISFEKLEAARYADCLKKGGRIITNIQEIDPMPVITGAETYPEDILDKIEEQGVEIDRVDALAKALEAGNALSVNIVLMGRLSRYFDIPEEIWLEALKAVVRPAFLEMNERAFHLGRE